MPPVASIVIPCGPRHVPLLARAVQSAYAQTVPVEVLTYIDRDKRGPAYGRNRLVEQASSPFVVTLDADDYLLPNFVEKCLTLWQPGSYVYTDWYQGDKPFKAISCYGFAPRTGESDFHLPPTLFPRDLYLALGGQDEDLFGAEDTDWFWKCNAMAVRSIHLHEPLFVYTDDGYRSKEAARDPRWMELLRKIFERYKGLMSMSCCGDLTPEGTRPPVGTRLEGDVLAKRRFQARQRVYGRATRRYYGKIGSNDLVWVDPRDIEIEPRGWVHVPNAVELSPTSEQIRASLQLDDSNPVALLEILIKAAGVRASFDPPVPYGYDIQQNPRELAQFLHEMQKLGVQRVLEIGTGENAGLARFMTKELGWDVTSIDIVKPTPISNPTKENEMPASWRFIEGDSREVNLPDEHYDLVFIDGDHTYAGLEADWDRFLPVATKAIAMHDVAEDGFFPDDVAKFWKQTAYGKKSMKVNYFEIIEPGAGLGIGWHVKSK